MAEREVVVLSDEYVAFDEALPEDENYCPLCGDVAGVLGQLGSVVWMSCRGCGHQYRW